MLFAAAGFFLGALSHVQGVVPANDDFNNALPLSGSNVVVTGSNENATKQPDEPDHGANAGGRSVWWTWQAPGSGSVIIQTLGSSFDTLLAAYSGAALSGLEATRVGSNDDGIGLKTSIIGFDVLPGQTYHIAVDGYDGAFGQISLSLVYNPTPLVRPVNDLFRNRTVLTGGRLETFGTNLFASVEPGEPDHAGVPGGSSIWWTWTAPASAEILIDTLGSDVDTSLAVYTGSSLTNLTLVTQSDDISSSNPNSLVTLQAVPGVAYQIAVDGYDGEPGRINLEVAEVPWLQAPTPVAGGGYSVALMGAPGNHYRVEVSSDLKNWKELSTQAYSEGLVDYPDPVTGQTQRFYRAVQAP